MVKHAPALATGMMAAAIVCTPMAPQAQTLPGAGPADATGAPEAAEPVLRRPQSDATVLNRMAQLREQIELQKLQVELERLRKEERELQEGAGAQGGPVTDLGGPQVLPGGFSSPFPPPPLPPVEEPGSGPQQGQFPSAPPPMLALQLIRRGRDGGPLEAQLQVADMMSGRTSRLTVRAGDRIEGGGQILDIDRDGVLIDWGQGTPVRITAQEPTREPTLGVIAPRPGGGEGGPGGGGPGGGGGGDQGGPPGGGGFGPPGGGGGGGGFGPPGGGGDGAFGPPGGGGGGPPQG